MAIPTRVCARSAAALLAAGMLAACSSPFDQFLDAPRLTGRTIPSGVSDLPRSLFRDRLDAPDPKPQLDAASPPDDYVRYALFNSPKVEAAYQLWLAASERLPQVSALPDPRLSVGFFLDEVETRTGAQQARIGVKQTFPWPGKLADREDAAARAAMAAWRRFEGTRLELSERVIAALYDLAYLDARTQITEDNLALLLSFEQVVRARYRVATGSHPELIRAQVELAQLDDRLIQLRAMRPSQVSELNALLNRDADAGVPELDRLPARVATDDAQTLAEIARRSNPALLALDEQIEEQRILSEVARADGLPDVTVGLDYIVTDEAANTAVSESGDDPIMLSLGINVPLWRDKYDAGVRETLARRLAISQRRADEANRLSAAVHRAWFEHTDAHRRVLLHEGTLIPKAEESVRASLAGFRAGDTSLLDLLDAERTLLEFAISGERARADRGKSLATLNRLVAQQIATESAEDIDPQEPTDEESQP